MLLLAGVAIQMTMGENGLIAKSVQAQKEQAKAELYDTAKLSYTSLNAKALENGQPSPQAELALSTTEFRDRYDIVGDDITDKKGTIIDTKANVLNIIQGIVAGGFTPGTTTPAESWPKTVAGVIIPEEEKNDMIIKLRVKNDTMVHFGGVYEDTSLIEPIEVEYGDGEKGEIVDLFNQYDKYYTRGEYILKFKNVKDFVMTCDETETDYEIEIIQWGKIKEKDEENIIRISRVYKIYEPEPDRIPIMYQDSLFTEIPEWLFSKKVTSTVMSEIFRNRNITSIPEGLFKNNVNAKQFFATFESCTGLTNIPENLFKHNVNVKHFERTFKGCSGLRSVPEGLFKNNVNAAYFGSTFNGCTGLTNIPEGLFEYNVNTTGFWNTFEGCIGLTSIPEELFKYNVNATNFSGTFNGCTGLTSIPEKIIEFGKKVKEKGGLLYLMFRRCIAASNYNSIPDYMK